VCCGVAGVTDSLLGSTEHICVPTKMSLVCWFICCSRSWLYSHSCIPDKSVGDGRVLATDPSVSRAFALSTVVGGLVQN